MSIAISVYFHRNRTMKHKESIAALNALASEPRLEVYRLLVTRGPEGYTPSDRAELAEVHERLRHAEGPVIEKGETTCYAQSEKSWIDDPQGVQWETFLTTGKTTVYATDEIRPRAEKAAGCAPVCSLNSV